MHKNAKNLFKIPLKILIIQSDTLKTNKLFISSKSQRVLKLKFNNFDRKFHYYLLWENKDYETDIGNLFLKKLVSNCILIKILLFQRLFQWDSWNTLISAFKLVKLQWNNILFKKIWTKWWKLGKISDFSSFPLKTHML